MIGDGGGGNGQDTEQNLLSNILRIDIDHGSPYGIPRNNPFVGRRGLDEIYAYGLRNPYRMSFDTEDGRRLFAGDAGQGLWEEVSMLLLLTLRSTGAAIFHRREELIERVDHEQHVLKPIDFERLAQHGVEVEWSAVAIRAKRVGGVPV
jgi:hypothetical protein